MAPSPPSMASRTAGSPSPSSSTAARHAPPALSTSRWTRAGSSTSLESRAAPPPHDRSRCQGARRGRTRLLQLDPLQARGGSASWATRRAIRPAAWVAGTSRLSWRAPPSVTPGAPGTARGPARAPVRQRSDGGGDPRRSPHRRPRSRASARPEASSSTRRPAAAAAARRRSHTGGRTEASKLSRRTTSAPPSTAASASASSRASQVMRTPGPTCARRARRASNRDPGEGRVVLLDHGLVEQAEPMVLTAARAHGVLLEEAQPGGRLARVEHAHARPVRDGLDEPTRQGRRAREALDEVEGDPLRLEQGAPLVPRCAPTPAPRPPHPRRRPGARHGPRDPEARTRRRTGPVRQRRPPPWRPARSGACRLRDRAETRDVPGVEVLLEGRLDRGPNGVRVQRLGARGAGSSAPVEGSSRGSRPGLRAPVYGAHQVVLRGPQPPHRDGTDARHALENVRSPTPRCQRNLRRWTPPAGPHALSTAARVAVPGPASGTGSRTSKAEGGARSSNPARRGPSREPSAPARATSAACPSSRARPPRRKRATRTSCRLAPCRSGEALRSRPPLRSCSASGAARAS